MHPVRRHGAGQDVPGRGVGKKFQVGGWGKRRPGKAGVKGCALWVGVPVHARREPGRQAVGGALSPWAKVLYPLLLR